MFDVQFLLDSLYTIAACISGGFLVYGGWLCLRRDAAQSAVEPAKPGTRGLEPPGQSL